MDKSVVAAAFAFVMAGTLGARAVGASEQTLLVVVESGPGGAVDAPEVRRAIAGELRTPVFAPHDRAAVESSDLLIVAVDRMEIRMSLRAGGAGAVSRSIAAPADRAGRLRSIAWLAGNLARDQIGGIVTPLAPDPGRSPAALAAPSTSAATATPAALAASPAPATEPRPAEARPATEPPPLASPVSGDRDGDAEATVTAARGPGVHSSGPAWAITVAGGPSAMVAPPWQRNPGHGHVWVDGVDYQIEVQRPASSSAPLLGVALEGGSEKHLIGLAAFVGSHWQRRKWFFEVSAGVGLEAARLPVGRTTLSNNSTSGVATETTVTLEATPIFYARGIAAAGLPLSSSVDAVVRLGAHLGSGGWTTTFVGATAGLRFRLP